MKNVISSSTTAQKVDLVSLIGFLEYYLPIIAYRIPTFIDEGGCGFFALHLHKVLKGMGIDTKIIYAIQDKKVEQMEYLKTNNVMPESTDDITLGVLHAVVALTPFISLDSDGVVKPLDFMVKVKPSCKSGELTEEQMQVLWDNKDSWNAVFDRDCCDKIVEMLSEIPQRYERFLVEGTIEFPTERIKLTDKTIEAKRVQAMFENPLSALLDTLGKGDNL